MAKSPIVEFLFWWRQGSDYIEKSISWLFTPWWSKHPVYQKSLYWSNIPWIFWFQHEKGLKIHFYSCALLSFVVVCYWFILLESVRFMNIPSLQWNICLCSFWIYSHLCLFSSLSRQLVKFFKWLIKKEWMFNSQCNRLLLPKLVRQLSSWVIHSPHEVSQPSFYFKDIEGVFGYITITVVIMLLPPLPVTSPALP